MLVLVWIVVVAVYFLYSGAFYSLAKKAGLDSVAWFAFVPVLSTILRLRLINWRTWWVVVLLIPIVDLVFVVIWQIRLLKAFNKHAAWVLLQVAFPIVYDIMWVIWGYSDDTTYVLVR